MNVQLISAEGDVFTVERHVISLSVVLNNTLQDYDDSSELEPIQLPEISTRILGKIIDYCRYHWDNPAKPIPKPLKSARLIEFVCPWDCEFVNVDKETLFELIMAENFLDIKPLLDLVCAKLASMIKGKSVQDIRDEFNIVNDFTPEEEARVSLLSHRDAAASDVACPPTDTVNEATVGTTTRWSCVSSAKNMSL